MISATIFLANDTGSLYTANNDSGSLTWRTYGDCDALLTMFALEQVLARELGTKDEDDYWQDL